MPEMSSSSEMRKKKLCPPARKKKRVAIIGAGWSGLMAIKILLEERDYFEPECFEAMEEYGGTWRFREDDVPGVASVMSTTIINHSKELGSISDFPPPEDYPNYMPHNLLFKYWTSFAEKHGCFKYIKYNHEVVKVERAEDYDVTGRWKIMVKDKKSDVVTTVVYDSVFSCVGHSTHPNIPKFKGVERFHGDIVHTHSIKNVETYKGKSVAVIGIGCSGLDASVETSAVAKKVYISTRKGAWILPRLGPYGLPFDYTLIRRWLFLFLKVLPIGFVSKYLENIILASKFSHGLYGLKPKHRMLGQDPAISDIFPYKLLTGAIQVKGDVQTFTEKGIIFKGEEKETELDSVILATGYNWKFPFFDEDIITITNGRINLYKCVYPPHLKHPTLAIIGFIQPLGPGFPFGEMQCRWAAQLLLGNVRLPSTEDMLKDIDKKHKKNAKRYPASDRLTIHVDYIPYLDDVASQFGAKPNLWKMAFVDPKLFMELFFGPSLPFQYRLEGPHPWPRAREAILTSWQRMKAPWRKGKQIKFCKSKSSNMMYFLGLLLMLWMALIVTL